MVTGLIWVGFLLLLVCVMRRTAWCMVGVKVGVEVIFLICGVLNRRSTIHHGVHSKIYYEYSHKYTTTHYYRCRIQSIYTIAHIHPGYSVQNSICFFGSITCIESRDPARINPSRWSSAFSQDWRTYKKATSPTTGQQLIKTRHPGV